MMKNFLFAAAFLAATLQAAAAGPALDFDGLGQAERVTGATLAERAALSACVEIPLAKPLPDKGYIPPVPNPTPAYPGGGQPGQPSQPVDPNSLPPFSYTTPFAAAVNIMDGTGGDAAFSGTGAQVSLRLSRVFAKSLVESRLDRYVELNFPPMMDKPKVLLAIAELEKDVINTTSEMVQAQLKNMLLMPNISQAQKDKMLRIIAEDERQLSTWREDAREEALGGANVRPTSTPNKFILVPGEAFQQLNRSFLGREYMKGIFRSI